MTEGLLRLTKAKFFFVFYQKRASAAAQSWKVNETEVIATFERSIKKEKKSGTLKQKENIKKGK